MKTPIQKTNEICKCGHERKNHDRWSNTEKYHCACSHNYCPCKKFVPQNHSQEEAQDELKRAETHDPDTQTPLTKAMKEREKNGNVKWKDEGDGFWSGIGQTIGMVAYIKVPENHPDKDTDYMELDVDVNGGLTYGHDCIFGWDYLHAYNDFNVEKHIKNALSFFRERYKKDKTAEKTPFDTEDTKEQVRKLKDLFFKEISGEDNRNMEQLLTHAILTERLRLKKEVEKVIDDFQTKQDLVLNVLELATSVSMFDNKKTINIICEELKKRLGLSDTK